MGEEVKMSAYEADTDGSDGDEERVIEWEAGLPNPENLTPLSQLLIPPELASAFRISPETVRTVQDVNRASRTTLHNLRSALSSNVFKSFNDDRTDDIDPMVVEWDDAADRDGAGSDSRKLRKVDSAEEADSTLQTDSTDDPSARSSKRPRLVWTPQLHKRFVDVVAHLGIKSAVPKTIMQLMNVEGLTRENVASHLQKYRLYLKRMQGFSGDGPSASDQLLSSTPLPPSLQEINSGANSHGNALVPIPIPIPMPVFGMPPVHGHIGSAPGYHGFESYPYNMIQQRDWCGNKYAHNANDK